MMTSTIETTNGAASRRSRSAALEIAADGRSVRIFDVVLPRRPEPALRTPSAAVVRHMVLDGPTAETMRYVAQALRDGAPLMLSGPTSTSKTACLIWVAHLLNWPLYRHNLSPQTEVGELVGRWVPNPHRGLTLAELARHAETLSAPSRAVVERCRVEAREPDRIEQAQICRAEGWQMPDDAAWIFQEGPLVEALRHGGLLLLDEVSLCPSAVIERLNSVLEKNPSFVVSEGHGEVFGGAGVPVHPEFRVAATMNPDYAGRASLSPAFLNRFSRTLRVSPASEVDYHQMLAALVLGESRPLELAARQWEAPEACRDYRPLGQLPGLREQLQPLATIHARMEQLTDPNTGAAGLGGQSRQPVTYTRRDLLAVLDWFCSAPPATTAATVGAQLNEAFDDIYLRRLEAPDRRRVMDLVEALGLGQQQDVAEPLPSSVPGYAIRPRQEWQTLLRPNRAEPFRLSFALQAGQTIEWSCAAPEGSAPAAVILEIYQGEALQERSVDNVLTFSAPSDGRYEMHVRLLREAPRSGHLQVAWRLLDGPPVRRLEPVGGLIGTVDGEIEPKEQRIYLLRCQAGKRYTLSTSPCSFGRAGTNPDDAAWDTILEVKGQRGRFSERDDDGGRAMTSKLSFRAPEDGDYRVIVSGYNRNAGPFRLSYTCDESRGRGRTTERSRREAGARDRDEKERELAARPLGRPRPAPEPSDSEASRRGVGDPFDHDDDDRDVRSFEGVDFESLFDDDDDEGEDEDLRLFDEEDPGLFDDDGPFA